MEEGNYGCVWRFLGGLLLPLPSSLWPLTSHIVVGRPTGRLPSLAPLVPFCLHRPCSATMATPPKSHSPRRGGDEGREDGHFGRCSDRGREGAAADPLPDH